MLRSGGNKPHCFSHQTLGATAYLAGMFAAITLQRVQLDVIIRHLDKGETMKRTDVTELILAAKLKKNLKWADIAKKIGLSKEWTTAALMGQMTLDKKQATTIGKLLGLSPEAVETLQIVPYKGSLPSAIPTDPLIYRFYELLNVYGTSIKALIHEEFGDGIMSAIDFSMDIQREADPKGDRVKITLNGKFLAYKTY